MKKILLFSILIIVTTSCSLRKNSMTKKEIAEKGYSIDKWNVTQNGKVIANLKSIEWELYNNKLVREMSVTTEYHMKDSDMIDMIKFLHTKYPDFKIEVNNDKSDFFE